MKNFLKSTALAMPPARRLLAQRDSLLDERAKLRAERTRLRSQLDAARAQLAQRPAPAPAEARGGVPREELRYLFFLTYGRSGTTLLQGILSSIPGVLIRGENGDAVYSLYTFHKTASSYRDKKQIAEPLTPQHPWWGIDGYPDDVALRHIRDLVLDTLIRPEPDSRIVGFKEIRWVNKKDLDEYIAFIRTVFPGAKFLLNTRNHADVAKSKWWASNPNALDRLDAMERKLHRVASKLGDDVYHVHYDDYKDNPEALRGMHQWLGEPFDPERVRAVMAQRHSY